MRIGTDGITIEMTVEEIIQLSTLGYEISYNDEGKAISIKQKEKEKKTNEVHNVQQ